MIFRPATPGFIVTLVATILLAIVSFNTPIIKSVFFLKATLTVSNVNGTITIGTLGYCIELSSNGTTCSSPSVGYAFDPNALLGNTIDFAQIPTVVVKWITYALFLHVIALCGAAIAAVFGLLAHVREMSMACCSTFISGFAAFVSLVAFIFDIVLFFIVKKRVEGIDGSASFGGAVWMTLAATILLFFSGCVYACGRCCISKRPRGPDGRMDNGWMGKFGGTPADTQAEQMRLDAVKAEADRKARQKNEVGLPAFPDRSEVLAPLKHHDSDDDDHYNGQATPYRDQYAVGGVAGGPRRQGSASTTGNQTYRGGYAQAPPGTRAVDEYYSPSSPVRSNTGGANTANTGYPPNRQYSTSPAASAYHAAGAGGRTPSPGVAAVVGVGAGAVAAGGAAAGYLSADHRQYPSGAAYGHRTSDTSYHTAASSQHQQYPSTYSQYDPYSQAIPQHQQQQSSFNADAYNQTGAMIPGVAYGGPSGSSATPPPRQPSQPYADLYSAATQPQPTTSAYANYGSSAAAYGNHDHDPYGATSGYTGTAGGSAYQSPTGGAVAAGAGAVPERSYTLGGGGYGANVVPDASGPSTSSGKGTTYGAPALSTSPPPMPSANVGALNSGTSYGQGQGQAHSGSGSSYEDAPPGYEANPSVHVPAWGSKV